MDLQRRVFLQAGLGFIALTQYTPLVIASVTARQKIFSSWQLTDGRYQAGVLSIDWASGVVQTDYVIDLPGRAHGVQIDAIGNYYLVARRPGDWLLHLGTDAAGNVQPRWLWAEAGRTFNGHLLSSDDGQQLYTVETDGETGQNLIAVRRADNFAVLAEWPTGGIDAHELVWHPQNRAQIFIANGGVETIAASGRRKWNLTDMDSSLVSINTKNGQISGQWRLADNKLSLRHLVWHKGNTKPVLGVALQAQHNDAQERKAAPLLARFALGKLTTHQAQFSDAANGGYGGDIAVSGSGFVVSCPKDNLACFFDRHGSFLNARQQTEVCSLTGSQGEIIAGGSLLMKYNNNKNQQAILPKQIPELDNHSILLA